MDELEGIGRLEISMEEERTVPRFYAFLPSFAVLLMRKAGIPEVQTLKDVMSDVSVDAK